jgi:hypothetical protein
MTEIERRQMLGLMQRVEALELRCAHLEARTSRSSQTVEAVRVAPDDPRVEPPPVTGSQQLARVVRQRRPSAPAISAVLSVSHQLDQINAATEAIRSSVPDIARGVFSDEESDR